MKQNRCSVAGIVFCCSVVLVDCNLFARDATWEIVRIGLFDSEHTRDDGRQTTTFLFDGLDGTAFGVSERGQASGGGRSTWVWTREHGTVRIGLTDVAHTGANGSQSSDVWASQGAYGGVITGTSSRSATVGSGQSAWVWTRENGTIQIGLQDSLHVQPSGYQLSQTGKANSRGQVQGESLRSVPGQTHFTPWIWRESLGTVRVGLVDPDHSRADGVQSGRIIDQNERNEVIGVSTRYAGGVSESAWIWDESNGTRRLALTDAGHTGPQGYQDSQPVELTETGWVIGTSRRPLFTNSDAASAWVWSSQSGLVRLGFTDAEHTRANGYQLTRAVDVNDLGQVVGYSERSNLSQASNGRTAWVWNPVEGLTRLGFYDANHTSASGIQGSTVSNISEDGRVGGSSTRFFGDTGNGTTAWTWSTRDGLQKIGLYDAEHTDSTGVQYSVVQWVYPSDVVVGISDRKSQVATGSLGTSLWVWTKDAGTRRVGLHDAAHTSASGVQKSELFRMNAAGQAVGYSTSYASSGIEGSTIWFFDSNTGDVRSIPPDPVAGYDRFTILSFNAAGEVIGMLRNTLANQFYLFKWSAADGVTNLMDLPPNDDVVDWVSFSEARWAGGSRVIIGRSSRAEHPNTTAAFAIIPSALCFGDWNVDGSRNGTDLAILLNRFGAVVPQGAEGDFNGDGRIDGRDLSAFLAIFGQDC